MKSILTSFFVLFSGCNLAYANIIQTANYPTVQAAIDAAKPGDTVQFTAKVYGPVPPINLKSGIIYDGNGASLSGNPVFPFGALSDIEIKNFALIGSGMSGVSLKNAKIHDNKFDLGSNGTGIYVWVSAPPDSCKVNPAQCNAAMPITATNVVIEKNDFFGTPTYTGQNEGSHFRFDTPAPAGSDNGPGKSTGFVFRNNRMRNISRCGTEAQGGGTGAIFEDNVFEAPTFSTNPSVNSGSMGMSLAMDASVNNIARRNKIDGGNSRQIDGTGVRNGIEGSGHGYIASDNYVANTNQPINLNNAHDNAQLINNQLVNNAQGAVAIATAQPYVISNNGPNVALSWNVSRPWPIQVTPPNPCLAGDSNDNTMIDASKTLCLGGTQIGILSGHISINGAPDNATSGLIGVLLYGKKIYQKTSTQFWLADSNPPKLGTSYSVVSDPRPVCVPKVCDPCTPVTCGP